MTEGAIESDGGINGCSEMDGYIDGCDEGSDEILRAVDCSSESEGSVDGCFNKDGNNVAFCESFWE